MSEGRARASANPLIDSRPVTEETREDHWPALFGGRAGRPASEVVRLRLRQSERTNLMWARSTVEPRLPAQASHCAGEQASELERSVCVLAGCSRKSSSSGSSNLIEVKSDAQAERKERTFCKASSGSSKCIALVLTSSYTLLPAVADRV